MHVSATPPKHKSRCAASAPPRALRRGTHPALGSVRSAGRACRRQSAPQGQMSAMGTRSSSRGPGGRAKTAACTCRAMVRTCRSNPLDCQGGLTRMSAWVELPGWRTGRAGGMPMHALRRRDVGVHKLLARGGAKAKGTRRGPIRDGLPESRGRGGAPQGYESGTRAARERHTRAHT